MTARDRCISDRCHRWRRSVWKGTSDAGWKHRNWGSL